MVLAHISFPVTGKMGILSRGYWPRRSPPAAHLLTSLSCLPERWLVPLCVLVQSSVRAVLGGQLLLTVLPLPVGLGTWFTGTWTQWGPVDQTRPCPCADGPMYTCWNGRGMYLLTWELLWDPFVVGTQPEPRKGV